mmetsp:Transcript_128562/g.357911  ORF Transcript_128562/g.357911 Transcript_128562/m.357911 type:complete len:88 (+) Transcript_128562:853-1116(+)
MVIEKRVALPTVYAAAIPELRLNLVYGEKSRSMVVLFPDPTDPMQAVPSPPQPFGVAEIAHTKSRWVNCLASFSIVPTLAEATMNSS